MVQWHVLCIANSAMAYSRQYAIQLESIGSLARPRLPAHWLIRVRCLRCRNARDTHGVRGSTRHRGTGELDILQQLFHVSRSCCLNIPHNDHHPHRAGRNWVYLACHQRSVARRSAGELHRNCRRLDHKVRHPRTCSNIAWNLDLGISGENNGDSAQHR